MHLKLDYNSGFLPFLVI